MTGVHPATYHMGGFLRMVLRYHFSRAGLDAYPGLDKLRHTDDVTTNKIAIDSWYNQEAAWASLNMRPAIYIKRNSCMFTRVNALQLADGSGREDEVTNLVVGSHTLFCLSKIPAESDLIGHDVCFYLSHFAQKIKQELCLFRCGVLELGATGILKEFRTCFVTPVTIGYAVYDSVSIDEGALRLQDIQISQP